MSNQYIIYNFMQKFKDLEAEVKWRLINIVKQEAHLS